MTVIAITISAVVCGWSILLVISDERQRELINAQSAAANGMPVKAEKAKATEAGKRKN